MAKSATTKSAMQPSHVEVINRKAVVIGLCLFALIVVGASLWRMAAKREDKKEIQEFKFELEDPIVREFDLQDPKRNILEEQVEVMEAVEVDESVDIQVSVNPVPVQVFVEVVESTQIDVDIPEIEVEATEIDLDTPEEIVEVSETIAFAVTPIATESADAAEIFKYDKPNPPDKPQMYLANLAPAPSRALKVLPKKFGEQDIPTMGVEGPRNINLFGTGNFFRTMTRSGGVAARSAVDSALHWLAVHQGLDGMWQLEEFGGSDANRVGVSGMAIMAFLGGGHTARKGAYRRNVMRAVEALMKKQRGDGMLDLNVYNHSIATIAICEAYGRARDERIGSAARKALKYLEAAQNRDGGWRYTPNSGTSDMSVSGWCIQALKTAKLAQLPVDNSVYARGVLYVDSLTDKGGGKGSQGGVGYTFNPEQSYGAGSAALTPAGMIVRQFTGTGVKSEVLANAAKHVRSHPPKWTGKDFYRWYYATYAMHNMGGADRLWWNRRIRDVLLEHQSRDGDNAGSWDPEGGSHGVSGGRVYTTALGALCLEVYYRYSDALNSFGVAPDLDDLFLQ